MFDYLSHDALASDSENKIRHSQSVALVMDVERDRVHMRDVHLTGHRDGLFLNGGCLFYEDGFVSGNVDLIFGSGMGLFEGNTIQTRPRVSHSRKGRSSLISLRRPLRLVSLLA